MKARLILFLLSVVAINGTAQELQSTRKTVVFHEAGYWCAEDYHAWPVGLYDTLCRVQNTAGFPAFYVEYDCFPLAMPNTDLMYTPANKLVGNTVGRWLNRPIMSVNFKGVLMDPTSYGDPALDFNPVTNKWLYRRPVDTFSKYVRSETLTPNVTAVGLSTTMMPGDSLVISTRVKFLSATSQQYNVIVFILEDSALGMTNNGSANAIQPHHYMLRYAGYDNVFGYAHNSGNPVAAGKEFFTTFSKKIPAAWNKKHLSYLMLSYRYDPATDHYDIDNATKGVTPTAVAPAAALKLEASVFPNPAHDKLYLNYSFPASGQITNIALTDCSGRSICTLYNARVRDASGILSLALPHLASGVYLLTVKNEFGALAKTLTITE